MCNIFFFKMAIFFFFQVYKTQLERVSEGWTNKMSNFERLNSTLRSSLSELQSENNELKTLVSTDYLNTVSSPINSRLFINFLHNFQELGGGGYYLQSKRRGIIVYNKYLYYLLCTCAFFVPSCIYVTILAAYKFLSKE